jgi:hypothetical protein
VSASARSEPRARVAGLGASRRAAFATRVLPSFRALALALALLALPVGGYIAARETSVFAVSTVIVEGASPRLARDVRAALAPLVGRSLVGLSSGEVLRPVEALAEVRSASYDRAFPNALVVAVRQEHGVAVLRTGADAWLVSERSRVLRRLARGGRRGLARVWLPAVHEVELGERIDQGPTRRAIAAAALARRVFPRRVVSARFAHGELTFVLARGRELRFGDDADLELKLAVAAAVLRELPDSADGGPAYLDVSVPARVVAGGTLESQVEVEG